MATKIQGGATADPLRNYRFIVYTVASGGKVYLPKGQVGFTEVDGLGLGTTDISAYVEGDDITVRKLLGRTTWGDLTMKKGLDLGMHLEAWRHDVIEGVSDVRDTAANGTRLVGPRNTLNIEVHDRTAKATPGSDTCMLTFQVEGAVPTALPYDGLKAADSGVLVATCTFAIERCGVILKDGRRFGLPG